MGVLLRMLHSSIFLFGALLCTTHLSIFLMGALLRILAFPKFSNRHISRLTHVYCLLRISAHFSIFQVFRRAHGRIALNLSFLNFSTWRIAAHLSISQFFQWAHSYAFCISLFCQWALCCAFYIYQVFNGQNGVHFSFINFSNAWREVHIKS